jgi:serralysin
MTHVFDPFADPPEYMDFINGTFEAGNTLSVDIAALPHQSWLFPAHDFFYRWLRDGETIPGASSDKYQLALDDVGKKISAIVEYKTFLSSHTIIDEENPIIGEGKGAPPSSPGNVFFGTDGEDNLNGTEGNDKFTGGAGDDIIIGGAGSDSVSVSGSINSYNLYLSPTYMMLEDRVAGRDGTDTLVDIETINFSGSPEDVIDLNELGGAAKLSPNDFESFTELYIAYFNRAPDAVGLNFWGTAFARGVTLSEIAEYFVDQEETIATYPASLSNADFATAVYNNVLGRVPDKAGFEFWVDLLDRGTQQRDQFILAVLEGVEDGSVDRAYLDSKVDIGAYYAVHKGMSNVANASAAMQLFDGTQAGTDRAVQAIDDFYASATDPTSGEVLIQITGVLDNPFEPV